MALLRWGAARFVRRAVRWRLVSGRPCGLTFVGHAPLAERRA